MDNNPRAPLAARAAEASPLPVNPARPDPPGLRAAVEYIAQGLRPVPLHAMGKPIVRKGEAVPATGKEPIGEAWGRKAHSDASLRRLYAENPLRGVGLQLGLGPGGEAGIFDLEVDDEFRAQFTLTMIFGGPRSPETMRHRSWRCRHHIYWLAPADAAQLRERGISRATIDGKNHAAYCGIELRFGTPDLDDTKETRSAAPPTPYERDDEVPTPRPPAEQVRMTFEVDQVLDPEIVVGETDGPPGAAGVPSQSSTRSTQRPRGCRTVI